MNVDILNPFIDQRWSVFISNHHNANIFHHPNWHSVLKKQYNFNTFIVAAINEEDKITAGVPFCEVKSLTGKTSWLSLPFSDHCQPLVESACELVRNMGSLGIPVWCYEWMPVFNWLRTSTTTPTRGGALATAYDNELMKILDNNNLQDILL